MRVRKNRHHCHINKQFLIFFQLDTPHLAGYLSDLLYTAVKLPVKNIVLIVGYLKRLMNKDRHNRVASLLKELAAGYIRQETNSNPLITVTKVSISDNYRAATVFFTTIPEGRENDALIFLKRTAGDFRRLVRKKTNLKIIPNFEFALDVDERHRQNNPNTEPPTENATAS